MKFQIIGAKVTGFAKSPSQTSRPNFKSKHLVLAAATLQIIISCPENSYAADFIVGTPTIVTNGSITNTLNGNDSLTITSSGEIAVTGAHAVDASGNFNSISNAGLIEVNGNTFNGINLQNGFNIVTNSNSGKITTTGDDGNGIQGLDNNIISIDGHIDTTGASANGVDVEDYNQITNTGLISTTGMSSRGITAESHNIITNSGTISTEASSAIGIFGQEYNTVINSGTIRTLGGSSDAIELDSDGTVINNGTIEAYGNASRGMRLNHDMTVINNGSITTANGTGIRATADGIIENNGSILVLMDQDGIDASSRSDITNRGSIETRGDNVRTIDAISGVVFNSGSVLALGLNSDGIEMDDSSIITNFGKVISASGASIRFSDVFVVLNANTLNLLAPSFIGGEIDLGSAFTTDTTVKITTGASHSVLWDFSTGDILGGDPTIDGTVPWFYNSTTKKIATFDPSVLAASVESLTDRTGMISATIQRRLEAAELMINGVKRGKPGDYSTGSSTFDKSGIWLQVMASQSEYDGSAATLERDITLGGLAVGYDASINMNTRFGVMAGYIDGSSEAASRWSNSFNGNSSGFFAAGYGRKTFNQLFVDLGLSAGIGTDNETKRFVNDNLAALGESYAMGDGGVSFWISPEIAIGTQIKGPTHWTFAPIAKLRYAAEWLGGYTETGPSADANATVYDRMIAIGEAKLELAASRHLHFGPVMKTLFTARGGVLGRVSLGDDATITLLGVTQDVSDFYEDSFAIFAGADTSIAVSEMINLDLSTSATFGNGIKTIQGAVAVNIVF